MTTNMKAFPNPNNTQQEGMDLRDWFAGLAMQGMLADPQVAVHRDVAIDAYYMADVMMEVREKHDSMEEKTSVPKD